MSVRLWLTDEAWAEIAPILTAITSRAGSPPVLSDRMFIEAVLYLARTGTPWRDLPEAFGHWDAVYNPTATLLEHAHLTQGFTGILKTAFSASLATAKPRFYVGKFGQHTEVTL
jgi:transposase